MLTHQAIFFFRRNKNNNSNDRRFALSSRFFLSLFLSFSPSMFLPLYFFYCQSLLGWHSFFSFSLNIVLHESEFLTNQITFVVVRRPGEKECMLLLLLLTSRGCSAWEKKCVYERERAYQALSSFATWFIDKSIKMYIHIWQ